MILRSNIRKKEAFENMAIGENAGFLLFPECLPTIKNKFQFYLLSLFCCLQMLSIWTSLKFCRWVKVWNNLLLLTFLSWDSFWKQCGKWRKCWLQCFIPYPGNIPSFNRAKYHNVGIPIFLTPLTICEVKFIFTSPINHLTWPDHDFKMIFMSW